MAMGKKRAADLLLLTVPEVRRLLRVVALPPAEQGFHLHWSHCRRQR